MLFTILLLGIFALCAVFVAVMGVKVYANSADKMSANFDTRTSLVYLSEKIRSNPGQVDVRRLGETKALVLTENINDTDYESWVFVYDDRLCETTIRSGDKVLPDAAQQIMDLKEFDATITDSGVSLTVLTVAGNRDTTFISTRVGL